MAQQQDTVVPPTSPYPGTGGAGNVAAQYTIYGTNEPYNGMVVILGGQMYTTQGGALEGFSYQVVPAGVGQIKPQAPSTSPQPRNSIVFRRGDGSQFDRVYWLPLDYRGPWGRGGGPVQMGTPLHYHMDSGIVMTEHHMSRTAQRLSYQVTTAPPVMGGLRRVPNFDIPDPFQFDNNTDQKPPPFGDKIVEDPMVDDTIIIDDPMGPDPFANQGGSNY